MWKLIFSILTNRGVDFNREPKEGEFSIDRHPSECAWFNVCPERYQYADGVFSEVSPEIIAAEKQEKTKAQVWEKIKAEREKRMEGGFKVQVRPGVFKWYHSDISSRIQHLGLKEAGSDVPPVPWKTMDGTFETMTPLIALANFQAAFTLDGGLFAAAEQHKAAMETSPDPANYDFTSGWPENFLGL